MVQNFKFKQNDTYGTIDYSLLNSDGTPFSIPSDATVSLYVCDKTYKNLLINKTAIIVDSTSGQVSYQLQQGDLISYGDFIGEFRVTFSNGEVKSFPQNGYLNLHIDQSIANGDSQLLIKVTEIQDFENSINNSFQTFQDSINDTVNAQEARVNNLISSTPQPSEVVDARMNAAGTTFPFLKDRLNDSDTRVGDITKLTTTDKTSLVNAVNSNVAQLADMVTIDVKQFGAIGDGVFDNKDVFASITTYIFSLNAKSCTILFPTGTYYTTEGMFATRNVDNVKVIGNNAKIILEGSDFVVIPYDWSLFYFRDVKRLEFTGLEMEINIIDKTQQRTGNIRSYHIWVDTSSGGRALEKADIYNNIFTDGRGYPNTTTKPYHGSVWVSGGSLNVDDTTTYFQKNVSIHDNNFNNSAGRVVYVGDSENVSIYSNKYSDLGDIGDDTFVSSGNTLGMRLMGVKNCHVWDNILESVNRTYTGTLGVDYLEFITTGASGDTYGVSCDNLNIHDNTFRVYTARTQIFNMSQLYNANFYNNKAYFYQQGSDLDRRFIDTTRGSTIYVQNVKIYNNLVDGHPLQVLCGEEGGGVKEVSFYNNDINALSFSPTFGQGTPISLLSTTTSDLYHVGVNNYYINGVFNAIFRNRNEYAFSTDIAVVSDEVSQSLVDALNKHTIRFSTAGTVDGLKNGASGQEILIKNTSTGNVVFTRQSPNVLGDQMIDTSNNASYTLAPSGFCKIVKMKGTDRWRLFSLT